MEDRQLFNRVLDDLETMLDDNRRRRLFFEGVDEAVTLRERWVAEQCNQEVLAFGRAMKRLPPPPPAEDGPTMAVREQFLADVRAQQGLSPRVRSVASPNPFRVFSPAPILQSAFAAPAHPVPKSPEAEEVDKAIDEWRRVELEAEEVFDAWARERAAEPPYCFAFLWRWHHKQRPVPSLLPGASPELAAKFNPSKIPTAMAGAILDATRRELQEPGLTAAEKPDGWTKAELRTQAGISETTFDRICEEAGVARPSSGQHGYRFGPDDLEKLTRAAGAKGGKRKWKQARERWSILLRESEQNR